MNRKLSLLRELDETIDFSKSTIQIEIMFVFMISKEKMTPSKLVELLDERRKAVLDALRKMQLKGIIKKEGEEDGEPVYALTETGEEYSKKLMEVLGLKEGDHHSSGGEVEPNREKIAVLKRMIGLYHIYNAIVYLANTPENKMDLHKLSSLVGLSPERMKSYLDAYSRPPIRVFRRSSSPVSRLTFYKLEKEGWNIYYRSPHYLQLKEDPISRVRMKVRIKLWRFKRQREILLLVFFPIKLFFSFISLKLLSAMSAFATFTFLSIIELLIALFSP
ncbi:MAG: hypothetical protein ACP5LZ_02235 [Fervidicoccaceae archaeon]